MKKLLLMLPIIFFACAAYAQIKPSGQNFTPGHTIRVLNSAGTVVGDAGGAGGSNNNGQGYLTELGITNKGLPFCINDALTNTPGGYHRFCFGANSLGGALLSYDPMGGASPLPLQVELNGAVYSFPPTGNGNVLGPTSSNVGCLAFFNNLTGTLLADNNWCGTGYGILAPTDYSFTMQGKGVFQVGGLSGPFMFNDTALDTISFQAKSGAGPSGDTTNLQLYPPIVGGKAFVNITKLASLSPAGSERLIIGTDGSTYVFAQVVEGTGTCHNVEFTDGVSASPAFTLTCGSGPINPSILLGNGGSITGYAAGISGNLLLDVSSGNDLELGAGANISSVVASKSLFAAQGIFLGNGQAITGVAAGVGGNSMIWINPSNALVLGEGANITEIDADKVFDTPGLILSTATPTASSGKIGFGTTTVAAASCGGGSVAACLVVNFGGTNHYIPFY
jgi:hypothetical protein